MSLFCLDANVFIQAKNGPYAFDILPRFWSWLDEMIAAQTICSSSMVLRELEEGEDELARWAKERRDSGFFVSPSQEAQSALADISAYVVSNFEPQHAQTFLDGADPWVIAQSKTDSSTVVTHEARAGLGSKKVKIPNICDAFSVPYTDLYGMMRVLGARFT
jgi:hypothetical protein